MQQSCEGGSSSTKDPLKTFSPEQLQCFQRCYEEGFDIYTDSDFKIHHPKLLLSDRFALNATENNTDEVTISDHFSSITPHEPLKCTETMCTSTEPSPLTNLETTAKV